MEQPTRLGEIPEIRQMIATAKSKAKEKLPGGPAIDVERTLVAEILNHLGYLLIAKSPLKSKVQAEAERYRGELLSSLDVEQRKPFLQSRDIVVELAKLLAKCQDRAMLGKTLTFIQSLSQGEVLIVEDDPNEAAMRQRLADHLEFLYGFQTRPDELNQIVNIVRNLTTSHEL